MVTMMMALVLETELDAEAFNNSTNLAMWDLAPRNALEVIGIIH